MSKTTLFDAQKLVYETEKKYGWHTQDGLLALALATEELGEVAREVRRTSEGRHGHNETVDVNAKKEEEIGDMLFTVLKLANTYNVDTTKALHNVVEKVIHRQKMKNVLVTVEIIQVDDESSVVMHDQPYNEAVKLKSSLEATGAVRVHIYGDDESEDSDN